MYQYAILAVVGWIVNRLRNATTTPVGQTDLALAPSVEAPPLVPEIPKDGSPMTFPRLSGRSGRSAGRNPRRRRPRRTPSASGCARELGYWLAHRLRRRQGRSRNRHPVHQCVGRDQKIGCCHAHGGQADRPRHHDREPIRPTCSSGSRSACLMTLTARTGQRAGSGRRSARCRSCGWRPNLWFWFNGKPSAVELDPIVKYLLAGIVGSLFLLRPFEKGKRADIATAAQQNAAVKPGLLSRITTRRADAP
jgi:hypothetical protein